MNSFELSDLTRVLWSLVKTKNLVIALPEDTFQIDEWKLRQLTPSEISRLHLALCTLFSKQPVATEAELKLALLYVQLLEKVHAELELRLVSFSAAELVDTSSSLLLLCRHDDPDSDIMKRDDVDANRKWALLERVAEAAMSWTDKFTCRELAQLMRSFGSASLEGHKTDKTTDTMTALNKVASKRLTELSSTREDVYLVGICYQWFEIYTNAQTSVPPGFGGGDIWSAIHRRFMGFTASVT